MRRKTLVASVTTLVLVVAGGTTIALGANGPASSDGESDPASKILAAVDSARVTSVSAESDSVLVEGSATSAAGDATRTLWYESLAGAAFAQAAQSGTITRNVLDPSGKSVYTSSDPAVASSTDYTSASTFSADDIASVIYARAGELGITVVDIHYVALFGGTAEVVVHPTNMTKTLATAMSSFGSLLGSLAQNDRPFLLTVVDDKGTPQLIIGHQQGMGDEHGIGLAWMAPGVETDAIVGQPIRASDSSTS
jgi:hypothetical protein